MKKCPKCSRFYTDETLNFCLEDGETLVGDDSGSDTPTAIQLPALPTDAVNRDRAKSTNKAAVLPANQHDGVSPKASSKPYWLAAGILVVLATAGYFGYRYYVSSRSSPITSIAVLPFRNRGGDTDSQYLSEGLAESLIYRLSQLPGLDVSPTSSVFRYEDKDVDPLTVGHELGVNAVVSGRIVQHGDSLTISAELVDVRTNKLLWGEQYDKKASELLGTQRDIARAIVDNLKLKIGPQEKGLAKTYTESNEAYQLYLKGRFYWNKRTSQSLDTAINYFNQAIQQDPSFALAYVGIADCLLVPTNPAAPNDKMPKAKATVLRALQLDDSLAEAHTSLARVLFEYDWNWTGAETEFQRAIELNPKYPTAHQWYGGYLESVNRLHDAIAERKKAVEIDPLSLIMNFELGLGYFYSRDYDNAIDQFHKTLELQPDFRPPLQFLPICLEEKGQFDAAEKAFKDAANLVGIDTSVALANLAHFYGRRGRIGEARSLLKQLEQQSTQKYVPADAIAMVYVGLADKDGAFLWLDKAYEERAFKLAWLKVEPQWDPLRSDPRFQALVKKIGIPE
jgi:TolB-like protein/Tfp pilus assembly protein PilF